MKLHLLSDLHLESGPYAPPAGLDADVVVAAGDICSGTAGVEFLAALGRPVIYVPGNHEFWPAARGEAAVDAAIRLAAIRTATKGTQVRVLTQGQTATLHGVRFVGATLWTNFGGGSSALMDVAHSRMRDYTHIAAQSWWALPRNVDAFGRWARRRGWNDEAALKAKTEGLLHPFIVAQWHRRDLQGIARALSRPFDGPTVVVTHHAPLFQVLTRTGMSEHYLDRRSWFHRFRDDSDLYKVAAYASDLDSWLESRAPAVDLWLFGHVHHAQDFSHHGVRFVSNPRGRHLSPLTAEKAKAYALLGMRVRETDIARSQEEHAKNPYRGDGYDFAPDLTLNPAQGPVPALQALVEAALERMAPTCVELRELLPLVSHEQPLVQRSVQEAVNARLAKVLEAWRSAALFVHQQLFASDRELSVADWDALGLVELSPNLCNEFRTQDEEGTLTYRAPEERAEDIGEVLASLPRRLRELPLLAGAMKQAYAHALQPLRALLESHGVTLAEEGSLFGPGARLSLDDINSWWLLGVGEEGEAVARKVSEVVEHRLRGATLHSRLRQVNFWVQSKSEMPVQEGAQPASVDVQALLAALTEAGAPSGAASPQATPTW